MNALNFALAAFICRSTMITPTLSYLSDSDSSQYCYVELASNLMGYQKNRHQMPCVEACI